LNDGPLSLRALLREAPIVQEGQSALLVIERLRTAPAHMVLVYDEFGHFVGIVTPMNILEAIAGEFPDEGEDEPKMVKRADGSYLVAGWMPVDEFAAHFSIEIDPDRDFETVAGLVLEQTGHLPALGEQVAFESMTIEVVDLDGRRIDKLLVSRRG
jgi:putative hemolysin